MNLKILDASSFDSNVKCTIHKNGKLGFSSAASNILGLKGDKSILFATEENEKDGNLYMIIQEEITDNAFKVNKAGGYFYLNTKAMFDSLGYDYKSKTIIFDIVKTDKQYEGKQVYKLSKREVGSKKK